MQQSDAMLLSTLGQYIQIPSSLTALSQIESQDIYSISCKVFDLLKVDYSQLKQIGQFQKFRLRTKLTQTLNNNLQTSFDLNDIINPSVPFIRKLLLAFIGKLGAEGDRNKTVVAQGENAEKKYQKSVVKKWIQEEFVCRELRGRGKIWNQSYLFDFQIKKDLFKRPLHSELSALGGANTQAVIQSTLSKELHFRKKREAEQGITRKTQQQTQRSVHRIIKNNAPEWQKLDVPLNRLKKLVNQGKNDEKEQKKNGEMSVFQQQVQKIAQQQKKKQALDDTRTQSKSTLSLQQDLNPLQRIRRECQNTRISLQNQLQQILSNISLTKQQLQQKESYKKKLLEQIILYEEKAKEEKQGRAVLKKTVEKFRIILESVEGEGDIGREVKELEEQVQFLQRQAQNQIQSLQRDIDQTKKEGEEKLNILKDLKTRLHKIQTDYEKICEQIEDKIQIKTKVKINQSGISRLYYNKKISEMEVRWRETKRESQKICGDVAKVKEEIGKLLSYVEKSEKEIDNISNASRFRGEIQNNTFRDIFNKCQRTFKKTIECLQELNETKNQIQEFETKVHVLAGKDYKSNIKKIQLALEQLKKQIKQLSKK